MRRALALAALLAVGCTVDQLVGRTGGSDGGTPVCSVGTPGCDAVCATQTCELTCATALRDCDVRCDGGPCTFGCETSDPGCTSTCTSGPCRLDCSRAGEGIGCTVTCSPAQTCVADCRDGRCEAACGALRPATVCDGGVATCDGRCP